MVVLLVVVVKYSHVAGPGAQEGTQVGLLSGQQLLSPDGQSGSSGDRTFIRNQTQKLWVLKTKPHTHIFNIQHISI